MYGHKACLGVGTPTISSRQKETHHQEDFVGVGSDPRSVWRSYEHDYNHTARFGGLEHHDDRPNKLVGNFPDAVSQ
jgi:hypothetical protein